MFDVVQEVMIVPTNAPVRDRSGRRHAGPTSIKIKELHGLRTNTFVEVSLGRVVLRFCTPGGGRVLAGIKASGLAVRYSSHRVVEMDNSLAVSVKKVDGTLSPATFEGLSEWRGALAIILSLAKGGRSEDRKGAGPVLPHELSLVLEKGTFSLLAASSHRIAVATVSSVEALRQNMAGGQAQVFELTVGKVRVDSPRAEDPLLAWRPIEESADAAGRVVQLRVVVDWSLKTGISLLAFVRVGQICVSYVPHVLGLLCAYVPAARTLQLILGSSHTSRLAPASPDVPPSLASLAALVTASDLSIDVQFAGIVLMAQEGKGRTADERLVVNTGTLTVMTSQQPGTVNVGVSGLSARGDVNAGSTLWPLVRTMDVVLIVTFKHGQAARAHVDVSVSLPATVMITIDPARFAFVLRLLETFTSELRALTRPLRHHGEADVPTEAEFVAALLASASESMLASPTQEALHLPSNVPAPAEGAGARRHEAGGECVSLRVSVASAGVRIVLREPAKGLAGVARIDTTADLGNVRLDVAAGARGRRFDARAPGTLDLSIASVYIKHDPILAPGSALSAGRSEAGAGIAHHLVRLQRGSAVLALGIVVEAEEEEGVCINASLHVAKDDVVEVDFRPALVRTHVAFISALVPRTDRAPAMPSSPDPPAPFRVSCASGRLTLTMSLPAVEISLGSERALPAPPWLHARLPSSSIRAVVHGRAEGQTWIKTGSVVLGGPVCVEDSTPENRTPLLRISSLGAKLAGDERTLKGTAEVHGAMLVVVGQFWFRLVQCMGVLRNDCAVHDDVALPPRARSPSSGNSGPSGRLTHPHHLERETRAVHVEAHMSSLALVVPSTVSGRGKGLRVCISNVDVARKCASVEGLTVDVVEIMGESPSEGVLTKPQRTIVDKICIGADVGAAGVACVTIRQGIDDDIDAFVSLADAALIDGILVNNLNVLPDKYLDMLRIIYSDPVFLQPVPYCATRNPVLEVSVTTATVHVAALDGALLAKARLGGMSITFDPKPVHSPPEAFGLSLTLASFELLDARPRDGPSSSPAPSPNTTEYSPDRKVFSTSTPFVALGFMWTPVQGSQIKASLSGLHMVVDPEFFASLSPPSPPARPPSTVLESRVLDLAVADIALIFMEPTKRSAVIVTLLSELHLTNTVNCFTADRMATFLEASLSVDVVVAETNGLSSVDEWTRKPLLGSPGALHVSYKDVARQGPATAHLRCPNAVDVHLFNADVPCLLAVARYLSSEGSDHSAKSPVPRVPEAHGSTLAVEGKAILAGLRFSLWTADISADNLHRAVESPEFGRGTSRVGQCLLKASVSDIEAVSNVRGSPSSQGTATVRVSLGELSASYPARRSGHLSWEPLLEPWAVQSEAIISWSRLEDNSVSIAVEASVRSTVLGTVNVTVAASTALAACQAAFARREREHPSTLSPRSPRPPAGTRAWSRSITPSKSFLNLSNISDASCSFEEEPSRARSVAHPYELRNVTGHAIRFKLPSSEVLHRVTHGSVCSFDATEWEDDANGDIIQHAAQYMRVEVAGGFDELSRVFVGGRHSTRARATAYTLRPEMEGHLHVLVVEVEPGKDPEGGRQGTPTVVTLRSSVAIINRAPFPLHVRVSTPGSLVPRKPVALEPIAPGSSTSVPLRLARDAVLHVRPYTRSPAMHAWSTDALEWDSERADEEMFRVLACEAAGAPEHRVVMHASMERDYCRATAGMAASVVPRTLVIALPLKVENLLPSSVEYEITDSSASVTTTTSGVLAAGEAASLHSFDPSSRLFLRLRITSSFGNTWSTVEEIPRFSDATPEPHAALAGSVFLLEEDGTSTRSLRVDFHKSRGEHHSAIISLFCEFWVVNRLKFSRPLSVGCFSGKRILTVARQQVHDASKQPPHASNQPLLYAHLGSTARERTSVARFRLGGGAEWSAGVDMSSLAAGSVVRIPGHEPGEAVDVAMVGKRAPGRFRRSVIVSIRPRLTVVNRTVCNTISCRQFDTPSRYVGVPTGQFAPLFPSHGHVPLRLSFALCLEEGNDPVWSDWSVDFLVDGVAEYDVKVPLMDDKAFRRVFLTRVATYVHEASIYVVISAPDPAPFLVAETAADAQEKQVWPLRVSNMTDLMFRVHQKNSLVDPMKVMPMDHLLYSWDIPDGLNRLCLSIEGGDTVEVNVNELGDHGAAVLLLHDEPVTVLLAVSAQRATRVLSIRPKGDYLALDPSPGSLPASDLPFVLSDAKFTVSLSGFGVSLVDPRGAELCYCSAFGIGLSVEVLPKGLEKVEEDLIRFEVRVQDVQVDNQLVRPVFPVVLRRTVQSQDPLLGGPRIDAGAPPALHAIVVKPRRSSDDVEVFRYASFQLAELTLKLDEQLLWTVFLQISAMLYPHSSAGARTDDVRRALAVAEGRGPSALPLVVTSVSRRMYFASLVFHPIKINVSCKASTMRAHGPEATLWFDESTSPVIAAIGRALSLTLTSIDRAPLSLSALVIPHLCANQTTLLSAVTEHYFTQLAQQWLRVLGSAEVLGNPVGLFTHIGEGVSDFVTEPAHGFMAMVVRGRTVDFGRGLATGSVSLIRHSAYGMLHFHTSMTSSLGNIVGLLTMDDDYVKARAQSASGERPMNVSDGLSQGLRELSTGVLTGATGIITHPVHGVQQEGLSGLFKGIGRGVVGLVVKPMAGMLDLAAHTSEGARNSINYFDEDTVWARRRFPRAISKDAVLRIYSLEAALGQTIMVAALADLPNEHTPAGGSDDIYEAHLVLPPSDLGRDAPGDSVVVVTSQRVAVVCSPNVYQGPYSLMWSVPFASFAAPQPLSVDDSVVVIDIAVRPDARRYERPYHAKSGARLQRVTIHCRDEDTTAWLEGRIGEAFASWET